MYIKIRPNSPKNTEKVKEFEKVHKNHGLILVDLEEVKGSYENVEGDIDPDELLTKRVIQEEIKKCRLVISGEKTFKQAFGYPMEKGLTPLMKYFEHIKGEHKGTYAVFEGRITKNYTNWLEKQLVTRFLF